MHDIDLIISGGKALLLDEANTCLDNAGIAIHDSSIIDIGRREDILKRYAAKKIIDAEGSLVLPGFVNTHTHAAMTCFRGIADDLELMDWLNNYIFPAEAKNVNPHLAYWGSMLACAEMIKSGTTTFCDMYIFEEETARAAKEAGVRCLVGEVLFDFPSPSCKTPEEGLACTRRLAEKWYNDPLVRIIVEPHSLYTCSRPLLQQAKMIADEFGLMLGIHLLENQQEHDQLLEKHGKSAVAFLDDIGYLNERLLAFHCVYLTINDISLFAKHGCKVSHNPASNMKLGNGIPPITDMLEAGITVGLGTDGCASNNTLDMIKEMSTAAKLHKVAMLDPTVMDAKTAMRMATINGARALGMGHLVGSLEVGKKADIILIGLNKPHLTPLYNAYSHMVYAAGGADVDTVVINGKVVMENRRLLTIAEADVMNEVRKIAVGVKKSMNM
ncbi:MAG: amidohydrolase [Smithellaceae bacterium]|jgi:5-methylthioadenosine/S-adenosylhomocysteine deaminase|nr:amidohydrolase [Smithellaceae bacterium]MDD3258839.1 amidohydrolase [Smithellaceae bacterium]MDD3849989.1 amidohydrolase [Smithellaceae bacterium]